MSEVKVNKITPTANCGTVTLGYSGDTVAIPAGVTLTSGGALQNSGTITNTGTITGVSITGTIDNQVNWQTTVKTANFTATAGEGYFCNTTSGSFTVTLPASPSAGDLVGIKDYANTADTNNIIIGRNGSNIEGIANDFVISVEGGSITLIYVDATKGWLSTAASKASDISSPQFVTATGGTITTCGNYKIHTFTGPGTFSVSCAGNACGSSSVDYLVVAGGGGSGQNFGGGSGAGGYRESVPSPAAWTASPIAKSNGALPVSAQGYPVTVGSGGAAGSDSDGGVGGNSIFSTITSTGGGGGGGSCGAQPGNPGGSGGGGGGSSASSAGAGNTPPVSPPQGEPGGSTGGAGAAAGGGATEAGGAFPGPSKGGDGAGTAINPASPVGTPGPSGSLRYFAGGGAGQGASGGTGGGASPGNGGTINTGGGAGNEGQTGGSGIVIIRYKFQ